MEIGLRVSIGGKERVTRYASTGDIILGRPGVPLPLRRLRMPTVFAGTGQIGHDPGTVTAELLDLTPDRKVSRIHARLYYDLSTWWIAPLSDTNRLRVNNSIVSEATELTPGDVIGLGETLVGVSFQTANTEPGPGDLASAISADETLLDLEVSEGRRFDIFLRVARVINEAKSRQDIVDGVIRELSDAYPQSSRRSLLLVEDRELVPRAFWPPERAWVSFTLARRAMQSQQSLRWRRRPDGKTFGSSLVDVTDALYAPMVVGGKALGVLHVDSIATQPVFSHADLQLLTVLATTVGAALRRTGIVTSDALERLPTVFVSYAHGDRETVDRIVADLRRRRVKVWVDERLKVGDLWREEIQAGIANSDALVTVISPNGLASKWVKYETEQAMALKKPVLPIQIAACEPPDWLSETQWVDAVKDYTEAIRQVAQRAREALS